MTNVDAVRCPGTWSRHWYVVPTPVAWAEVRLTSTKFVSHLGLFSRLLAKAKTSAIGRLMMVLISIFMLAPFGETQEHPLPDVSLGNWLGRIRRTAVDNFSASRSNRE